MKKFIRCKRYKEANENNWSKSRRNKDNFQNWCKECYKEYRSENKDKCNLNNINNRAVRKGFKEKIHMDDYIKMKKFFSDDEGNIRCAYTGNILDNTTFSIDHLQAYNEGGRNIIPNIIPCMRGRNYSKGDKTLEKWYQKQEFFDRNRLHKIYDWINYATYELLKTDFDDIIDKHE